MDPLLAFVLGVLQGVLEWLPVSSEGGVALFLTVVRGADPVNATRLSLFLHAGTALAAAAYYRQDVVALLREMPRWRPPGEATPDLTFFGVATVVSGCVGIVAYLAIEESFSALTGGGFVALVGVLLVGTGILQRVAEARLGDRETPTLLDALLVGALQGLAILPGVSRSGTTVSALLLRGYAAPAAFRLSFVLAIPASLGAGILVVADGGLPAIGPTAAVVALATSAVVGYATVGALVRVARRVAFWKVCLGLGGLAIAGGAMTVLL